MNRPGEEDMIRPLVLLPAAFVILLAGCAAVGPDYVPPEMPAPATWNAGLEDGLSAEEMDPRMLASWWTVLDDPILSSLIERAVEDNLDLEEARARVREARARVAVSGADLFPTMDATGSVSQRRSSEETGGGATRELYAVGFDASWELDLFGGKRRAIEAAEAELEATEEDLRDVLVSLLAEVALNYVQVRRFQTRLSIAQANLDAQEETYNIARWRFQAGLTTQLDGMFYGLVIDLCLAASGYPIEQAGREALPFKAALNHL